MWRMRPEFTCNHSLLNFQTSLACWNILTSSKIDENAVKDLRRPNGSDTIRGSDEMWVRVPPAAIFFACVRSLWKLWKISDQSHASYVSGIVNNVSQDNTKDTLTLYLENRNGSGYGGFSFIYLYLYKPLATLGAMDLRVTLLIYEEEVGDSQVR